VYVHDAFAGTVPFVSARLAPPPVALSVPEHPAPEIAAEGDAPFTSPDG
jgi:hypothetical protein